MKTVANYIKKHKLPTPSNSEGLELEKIFDLEEAISLIHRTPGGYGHLVDALVTVRRDYIESFNLIFGEYKETSYY